MRLATGRAFLAVFLVAPALLAQRPTDRLTLDDYLEWETVSNPQLSPDGRQIIFSRGWVDKVNDRRQSSLWVMNADGSRLRALALDGSAPRYSPDGNRVAYTRDGEPRGTQIWVKYLDIEGPGTQITRLDQSPSDITWTPDGKSILFRVSVPRSEGGGGVERMVNEYKPRGATWTAAPRVIEKLQYRRDGQGFTQDNVSHLFIVPADGGTARQLTHGEYGVNALELTPDGKTVVFSSGPRTEDAEYAWRESDIYSVDVATGTVKQLTTRSGPDGSPSISPDGKLIAYTGYDKTTDTWTDSRLHVMGIDGSGSRLLTPNLDRTPREMIWAKDGTGIYFTVQDKGASNLYFASLRGEVRQVTRGQHILNVAEISPSGLAVGTLSDPWRPADIVSFDVRTPQEITQLTSVNADILQGRKLGAHHELWFKGADNWDIQGWYITPPDFDASRKYPMMLSIHGGPHSMYGVGFNFGWQEHAANDYIVLYINPRGSTGYGSAFGNAIKNAYPGKDFDDLMAGVDALVARGNVDTTNMFVYGCSGGGVLTAWTVGHTDRFAAAASLCPVINWLSFVGTTDGASWYRNFAKLPWDDPSEHLKRSPLMYVGNVKTPTILMTGVNDLRTPIGQTEEFYEALKMMKVPTAMVRFNEEWHGTSSKPSNFIRTQLYLRDWFQKYSRKQAAASR
jgi:dipeptidyl aminopeptidase/acylaminoacyl peptidase